MISQINYLIDCKQSYEPTNSSFGWDLFFSAFNNSDRVVSTFGCVSARNKYWLLLPEYAYAEHEEPTGGDILKSSSHNEADYVFETIEGPLAGMPLNSRICVDITGMMRPHILFLLRYFQAKGFGRIDMLYTEPQHYRRKEETSFASENIYDVRQVAGYEGVHSADMANDVLVIGIGYDHNLISHVIGVKERARLVQLHSLPSLSADMYQESLLRLERVSAAPIKIPDDLIAFSSANDPFSTAATLSETIARLNSERAVSNLYLSPLATKPQTLGFGIYYLREQANKSASIIFPFTERYERETSIGVGRRWVYPVHF